MVVVVVKLSFVIHIVNIVLVVLTRLMMMTHSRVIVLIGLSLLIDRRGDWLVQALLTVHVLNSKNIDKLINEIKYFLLIFYFS